MSQYPTITVLFHSLLAFCFQMAVSWAFFPDFNVEEYYSWLLFGMHFLLQLLLYHVTFYRTWLGKSRHVPLFNGTPIEDVKAVSSKWIKTTTCTFATPPTKPSIPMYVVFTEDVEDSDRYSFDHVTSFEWWATVYMIFRKNYILAKIMVK